MRVRLLGTGSADGWPNAFCDCASCLAAHQAGQWRSPTSALVDGTILLDCGPETPRAALRHDGGLQHVTHILITHNHPDHSAPMALLARAWAGRKEPITVAGPESVIATWCQWTGPDDPVRWQVVMPGDVIDTGQHVIRVLAAAHGDEAAVLYDVTGPTGERLLYATDTGPLPEHSIAACADAEFDLVLLEATFGDRGGPGSPAGEDHLDLSSFADQMVRLRGARAVTRGSQVSAVHLSHHSPTDLRPRLAAWGVQVVDDGHEFVLDRLGRGLRRRSGQAPFEDDEPLLPRRTLVLGGVRSGKSTAAENLLAAEPHVIYVATGHEPADDDPEWAQRVAAHQARRPEHWTTLETTDIGAVLRAATEPVLIDCLALWMTAVLGQCGAWDDAPGWQSAVDRHVDALVEAWHGATVPVVAVSNEVGSGIVPPTRSGRIFRDQLGRLNTRISAASERVVLVVAGRLLDLTALPTAVPVAPAMALTGAETPSPAAPVAVREPEQRPRTAAPLRSVDTAIQPVVPAFRPRPVVDLTVHDKPGPPGRFEDSA